jgi:hypothetical protein
MLGIYEKSLEIQFEQPWGGLSQRYLERKQEEAASSCDNRIL